MRLLRSYSSVSKVCDVLSMAMFCLVFIEIISLLVKMKKQNLCVI